MTTQNNEISRELMRLHWEQCKHIETERYWFMSVYAAVTGVMLGLIFRTDIPIDPTGKTWLYIFLIALTNIGFLINIRWMQAFEHHQSQIKKEGSKLKIDPHIDVPHKGIFNIFRTKYLFPLFYLIILIGLLILASKIVLYIVSGVIVIGTIISLPITEKNQEENIKKTKK
jgi:hypothetical protein